MQKWYWVNSMKADFEKGTKICSRCKKELPIEMFSENGAKSDNLCCYCKQCEKERNKQYRDNRKNIETKNIIHLVEQEE